MTMRHVVAAIAVALGLVAGPGVAVAAAAPVAQGALPAVVHAPAQSAPCPPGQTWNSNGGYCWGVG